MELSRRRFLQLGAAAGTVAAGAQFGALEAIGKELIEAGEDVTGGKQHATGSKREAVATTCLQCGVTDGVLAYTEGEGDRKRIVKLEGNPKNPNTCFISPPNEFHDGKVEARLCAKGQAGLQQVYDPFRIRYPMMRDPEKRGDPKAWKRITWEEAVDEVAKRLNDIRTSKEAGRFVFHQGRNRFASFTKRFVAAFGSKHYFSHTSLCEASLKIGYETSFGQDLDAADARNARMHIAWGENIYEAAYMHNPLAQRIAAARVGPNKLKLVAVDPRMSQTAGAADEWLSPKPSTDAAVILAMANVIMQKDLHDKEFLDDWSNYDSTKLKAYLKTFTPEWAADISGVPATAIERLAIEFATNQPSYVRAYNGISNHYNGVYNARCIALINAVVGNIDKKGGFCLMKFTGFGDVEPVPDASAVIEKDKLTDEFPLFEKREEDYPLAHHGADHLLPFWSEETKYKIGLYMLHQFNPVYVAPDAKTWLEFLQDPEKVEFIMDFSPFVSETVQECCDLVIPDCTYLERTQINDMPPVENFPFVHVWQPVIQPLYESRSMYDTMLAIAKKVKGMEEYFAFESVEEYCQTATEAKWGPGSWERLKADGVLINPSRNFGDPEVKPADANYKSFDQFTYEEVEAARQFDTFRDPLSGADVNKMKSEGAKVPSGDGPIRDKDDKKTLGFIRGGKAYKGFGTPSGRFEIFSGDLQKAGFEPLPVYAPVPHLEGLSDEQMVMISGKINVHTQSRTANCSWLMEIAHANPAWISFEDAKRLGVKTGDEVTVVSHNEANKMTIPVYVTHGIKPGVIFISTSLGHWEYGPMASRGKDVYPKFPGHDFRSEKNITDNVDGEWFKGDQGRGLADVWWRKHDFPMNTKGVNFLGKETVGWHPNYVMHNDVMHTDPVGGEYAWSGTPVRVLKGDQTKDSDAAAALGVAGIAAAAVMAGARASRASEVTESTESEVVAVGATADEEGGVA